jgi:spore germination protein YaaH
MKATKFVKHLKSMGAYFIATLFLALVFILPLSSVYALENTFYVLHHKRNKPEQKKALERTQNTIEKNHHSIQMLISQAYQIDEAGNVTGYVDPELVALAKAYSIKFMAMITNTSFNKPKVHTFLSSKEAQEKAIGRILDECKKNHFYGIQFDFENVSVEDKKRLTGFYEHAAKCLHDAGYKVSFAIIPAFTKNINESIFLRKSHEHWSGVYDLKALGKSSDFVTIMAYNQHNGSTIPGPNASVPFVKAAIKNALKEIPANKLSLGVPTYSLHWYSGKDVMTTRQSEISHDEANVLIKQYHPQLFWNTKEKVYHAVFLRNWLNEYLYLEEARSFKVKLALAKKFKLYGISVFCIGDEDKQIWKVLERRERHFARNGGRGGKIGRASISSLVKRNVTG